MFLNQLPFFLQPLKEHQMLKAYLNFFAVVWFVDGLLLGGGKEKKVTKTKVVKSTFMIASSLTKPKNTNGC